MFRFHDPTSPMPEAEIQVMVSGGNNIGRDLSRIGEEPTCTQLTSLSREALNLQKKCLDSRKREVSSRQYSV